jgi:hypothetical protein
VSGLRERLDRLRERGLSTQVYLVALAIALIGDAPKLRGTRGLEAQYNGVKAHTGAGFWLEVIGGLAAVGAGAAGLAGPRPAARSPRRER